MNENTTKCYRCGKLLNDPLYCCREHENAEMPFCETCIIPELRKELYFRDVPISIVFVGPRLVDGMIHRLVMYPIGFASVQTWKDGKWWFSGHLVEVLWAAPPTPRRILIAMGLPECEITEGACDDMTPKAGDFPEPLEKRRSDKPVVRILVGPTVIRNKIRRLVQTLEGKAVSEEWIGPKWYRVGHFIGELMAARPATEKELDEQGVPETDRQPVGDGKEFIH